MDRAPSARYGAYLADAQGDALYMLSADPRGHSTCTGACAAVWPPLTVNGPATAGAGITAKMVGTITRPSGGAVQVTYDGHPLYTFTGDHSPGQTAGEGIVHFGGTWTLVSPAGNPIERQPAASSSGGGASKGSGSSGGYTY